jgi:hypothetical protein
MTREQILAELAKTRSAISHNAGHLRHDLDVGARVRSSIARNTTGWLVGAIFIGFLLSGRRKTKVIKVPVGEKGRPKRGRSSAEPLKKAGRFSLLLGLVRMAVPVLKPIIRVYGLKMLTQLASRLKK